MFGHVHGLELAAAAGQPLSQMTVQSTVQARCL